MLKNLHRKYNSTPPPPSPSQPPLPPNQQDPPPPKGKKMNNIQGCGDGRREEGSDIHVVEVRTFKYGRYETLSSAPLFFLAVREWVCDHPGVWRGMWCGVACGIYPTPRSTPPIYNCTPSTIPPHLHFYFLFSLFPGERGWGRSRRFSVLKNLIPSTQSQSQSENAIQPGALSLSLPLSLSLLLKLEPEIYPLSSMPPIRSSDMTIKIHCHSLAITFS